MRASRAWSRRLVNAMPNSTGIRVASFSKVLPGPPWEISAPNVPRQIIIRTLAATAAGAQPFQRGSPAKRRARMSSAITVAVRLT